MNKKTNPHPVPKESDASWPREKLRELDPIDAEFGEEFYDRMHDQIMARIQKTPMEPAVHQQPDRKKAISKRSSRLSLLRPSV